MSYFPSIKPADPFQVFMAKLVGKKIVEVGDLYETTAYLYKGYLYITSQRKLT